MRDRRIMLASSAAGVFALLTASPVAHAAEENEEVRCYGINACKGKGDCGGKGHSCAGQNECKGKGYLQLEKDTCLNIQDARLTPEAEEPEAAQQDG